MHLVGKWLDRKVAQAAKEEEEWQAADDAGKQALLEAAKVELHSSKNSNAELLRRLPPELLYTEYGGSSTAEWPPVPKDGKPDDERFAATAAAAAAELAEFARQEAAAATWGNQILQTSKRLSKSLSGSIRNIMDGEASPQSPASPE